MATIGYARISTREQDLTIQREARAVAGCSKIYAEKITGARSDRPQFAWLVKALEPRDISIVTRLDRQPQ
jgi:DNA invertase Pin-like site-specific DNA recombinase